MWETAGDLILLHFTLTNHNIVLIKIAFTYQETDIEMITYFKFLDGLPFSTTNCIQTAHSQMECFL